MGGIDNVQEGPPIQNLQDVAEELTMGAVKHLKHNKQREADKIDKRGVVHEDIAQYISSLDLKATHLISSPYTNFANLLRVDTLDRYSTLLAFALTSLKPVRSDYATADYMSSFNWSTVFRVLRSLCQQQDIVWPKQEFYVVIFRSLRRRDADPEIITKLDQESHREACESGGLLKYWFGDCDGEMRNLATCIWRNQPDAVAGGGGPWHARARAAAREIYERIEFQTHTLVIEAGAEQWHLEEFVQ
ncbi:hypothetical protein LTR17_019692 [Elasticomyces elasticus]|nr:hypothetical protein LTR17_019692 [Elasticomyces elasticus]